MNYGNVNVDEKYSRIVEPNLYADAIFQPNVTYTDEFQGDANCGLVKIYKQNSNGVVDPGVSAGDFTDEDIANTLLDIRLNNAFRKSKKVYRVAANSVSYQLADTTLSNALQDCKLGWQTSALACLVKEGTESAITDTINAGNVKEVVVKLRKELRDAGATADVCIVSTSVYAAMLERAGDKFTPVTNDGVDSTGKIGMWLGFLWIEANLLNRSAAKYYDNTGALQTIDLSLVDIIMYDHTTFAIIDNLEEIRIVDTDEFVGSKAQVEFNTGYRVRNALRVAVKKHSNTPITPPTEPTETQEPTGD